MMDRGLCKELAAQGAIGVLRRAGRLQPSFSELATAPTACADRYTSLLSPSPSLNCAATSALAADDKTSIVSIDCFSRLSRMRPLPLRTDARVLREVLTKQFSESAALVAFQLVWVRR